MEMFHISLDEVRGVRKSKEQPKNVSGGHSWEPLEQGQNSYFAFVVGVDIAEGPLKMRKLSLSRQK